MTYSATIVRALIGAMLLMGLCFIAGRPQVFSDTRAYYALGQEVVGVAIPAHASTDASALRGHPLSPTEAVEQTRLAYTVSASRSPYWSALFYAAARLGSAWLVVVAQAVTAALVVLLACKALGVGRGYPFVIAVLALASSLPVQVMFLMPDLFAGLAILAALALATGGRRLTRLDRALLWATMAGAALFHTSHLLVLAALGLLTVGAGMVRPRFRRLRWPGMAMLGAAAVGAIGAVAFPQAVLLLRHERVYAPPFVAARLIADGPGRAVLQRDCAAGDAWGWCPYLDRPLGDVNTILWDKTPGRASFQAADYARRVRIIDEQTRFAVSVVTRHPAETLGAIAANIAGLLLQFGSVEALGDPTALYRDPEFAIFARIVPGTAPCVSGAASCAPRLDIALIDAVVGFGLVVSIVGIAFLIRRQSGEWRTALALVLAGLVLNAIICGGISGNAQRYQSRITWLLPFLAAAMACQSRMQRRDSRISAPLARS